MLNPASTAGDVPSRRRDYSDELIGVFSFHESPRTVLIPERPHPLSGTTDGGAGRRGVGGRDAGRGRQACSATSFLSDSVGAKRSPYFAASSSARATKPL